MTKSSNTRILIAPKALPDCVQYPIGSSFDVGRLSYTLLSGKGDPEVDPAIWFVGRSKGPE